MDTDLKHAVDTLARYVIGHGGTAKAARGLAKEIIFAIGHYVTEPAYSPGAVGCDLAATRLNSARHRKE